MPTMIEVMETAAEKVGGIKNLSRLLGMKHQSFYSWKRVPAERALEIERLTGIPRHELRPDLWRPRRRAAA